MKYDEIVKTFKDHSLSKSDQDVVDGVRVIMTEAAVAVAGELKNSRERALYPHLHAASASDGERGCCHTRGLGRTGLT